MNTDFKKPMKKQIGSLSLCSLQLTHFSFGECTSLTCKGIKNNYNHPT